MIVQLWESKRFPGLWVAEIGERFYHGSRDACVLWLWANGEEPLCVH